MLNDLPRLETVRLIASHNSSAVFSGIDSSYAWVRLAASVAFGTVGGVGMWSMPVVLPSVQAEFGVLRADASLPFTLTMLGFAFGGVAMGRLQDRFGILAPALLGTGLAHAALTTTEETFEKIAESAVNKLTVMTPFLNSDGLITVLRLFRYTRASAKYLIIRRAGGACFVLRNYRA